VLYRLGVGVKHSESLLLYAEFKLPCGFLVLLRALDTHLSFQTGETHYWTLKLNTPQIGFYHVCGADHSVLHGTAFADYQSVFDDAWNHILNAIVTANKYQIGVLIGERDVDRNRYNLVFFEFLRSYLQTYTRPPESRYVLIPEVSAQIFDALL
jgi:hypothetical protein